MRRILLCFSIAASIYSCGSKQGKGNLLTTAKMQDVLWDMFLADAYTEKYLKTDSSNTILIQNAALQEKIFDLHHINREDFYKSYHYYSAHPDLMRIMLDSINVRTERERNALMIERYSGNPVQE